MVVPSSYIPLSQHFQNLHAQSIKMEESKAFELYSESLMERWELDSGIGNSPPPSPSTPLTPTIKNNFADTFVPRLKNDNAENVVKRLKNDSTADTFGPLDDERELSWRTGSSTVSSSCNSSSTPRQKLPQAGKIN